MLAFLVISKTERVQPIRFNLLEVNQFEILYLGLIPHLPRVQNLSVFS